MQGTIEVMSGLRHGESMKHEVERLGLDVDGGAGHLEIKWDQDCAEDRMNAERMFDDLVDGKKYRAFKMNDDGSTGEQVDEFDPNHGRYLMMPALVGG
jgi:hypothetical protein